MRHTRKCWFIAVIMVLSLALTIPAFAQGGGPPGPGVQTAPAGTVRGGVMMPHDVYTPIAKGYNLVRENKYEAARHEFEMAAKLDHYNPFALNNMAVLDERDGKLNDALAHLKDATLHAAEYKDRVTQTCFVGGGCLAVKPVRAVGEHSTILPIIQENIKKLEAKIAATKTPPPPVSPPPVTPPPKTK